MPEVWALSEIWMVPFRLVGNETFKPRSPGLLLWLAGHLPENLVVVERASNTLQ